MYDPNLFSLGGQNDSDSDNDSSDYTGGKGTGTGTKGTGTTTGTKGKGYKGNRETGYKGNRETGQISAHVRTNEHNLYTKNFAELTVGLPPYQIKSGETKPNLLRKIAGQFSGRCSNDGYVKPGTIEIVNHSSGKLEGPFITFTVVISYMACNPPAGTIFTRACKCISVTKAGIHAEITDMNGNKPAEIFVHRDLFPTNVEFNEIKVGDVFSARVINSRFELNDPRISLMCEVFIGDGDTQPDENMANTSSIDSILEKKHLDLNALVDVLMSVECPVVNPTPSDYLTVYTLESDSTSYITRAIQEIPILRTKIKSHGRVKKSFMEAWNASEQMRERIEASTDITEAKWDLRHEFGYSMVTTFMPPYARQIFRHFNAKRILDPCGGWGDRLLGAFSLSNYLVSNPTNITVPRPADNIVEKYVCFDPNPDVFPGYAEIGALMNMPVNADVSTGKYLRFENGFEAHMLPFEVGAEQLTSESFDLVFTSPPFFEYEIYTESNPTYKNWLLDFYRPLMVQSHRCVKMGGHVCIHIDNTSAGDIEPFMRNQVEKMVGLELVGRIGLTGFISNQIRTVWVFVKIA